MTRRDKCDACRKAKIKCDESSPQCFNCVRLGKACTRDQYTKAQFKFVEDASNAQRALLGQRKSTVVVRHRRDTGQAIGRRAARPIESELSQADLFWSRSESSTLLARWAFSTENYIDHVDSYGGWSTYVLAISGELSNVDAVRSIRQALETRGSPPCKGDILLAVQLLYVVEVMLTHNPSAFVIHVEGLIALLKAHKKHLGDSDDQEELMSRIIFQSTFASGARSSKHLHLSMLLQIC
ncbi:Fungal Zn2-Cys6 binuclear cluster domain-containing protein [Cladophialophora immunda]|nr:Fungal Zn2-Cys6 binuclear cluster domain-containing protein [Cladophialophora immunda]